MKRILLFLVLILFAGLYHLLLDLNGYSEEAREVRVMIFCIFGSLWIWMSTGRGR